MGTVHAKSEQQEVGGNSLFEFEEPVELVNEPIQKPSIKLDGVRARVDKVHIDGLKRTKDDIIKSTIDDLFHATDFEDVIVRAHKVRRALDAMGCFRDVGVFIDVSSGPGATPEGLEVTFQVKEFSRIVGGINTTVSENEGNLVLGVKLPNVLGRGEKLAAEYSMGYRSSSNFHVTASKPAPHKPLQPVVSATVYQQNSEYPWSGYKLLDRGLLMDLAFRTSPYTKHNLQWEGLIRDTSVLNKTTSFKIRESSGPQMKSLIRHIVTVDRRDEPVFPTRGTFACLTTEVAGLGGSVAHLKTELNGQANVKITDNIVLQASVATGVLHDVFGTGVADRLYLGGPTTLRGFSHRGAGPHHDSLSTGGDMYVAGAAHIYAPLPFTTSKGPISELFRTHLFITAGSIADSKTEQLASWSCVRASVGLGVALRLGALAKAELNYCIPIKRQSGDSLATKLQAGLNAYFL